MNPKEMLSRVEIAGYDPSWPHKFQQQQKALKVVLGENCLAVHHIGSTSIPGLAAKAIIDILLVVADLNAVDAANENLATLGYTAMGEYGILQRRFFWQQTAGIRNFNLHIFAAGNNEIKRHLAFRDYLIAHADQANGYGAIKKALAKHFSEDIQGYVEAKDSFVRCIHYRAGVAKQEQLSATDEVCLEQYNPRWENIAAAEIAAIKNFIQLPFNSIHHLGSTSVPNMQAKPIIDIFIGLDDMQQAAAWQKPLYNLGYDYWQNNPDKNHARYFKGMPPFGIGRTHHIHILPVGEELNKRIQFKRMLDDDPVLAAKYLKLKQQLAERYADDREMYTKNKGDFIKSMLK